MWPPNVNTAEFYKEILWKWPWWSFSYDSFVESFLYNTVADPEGVHLNPAPIFKYENEIIWSQWDQIISFSWDIKGKMR